MKRPYLFLCLLFVIQNSIAQNDPIAEYENFKQQAHKTYNDFRKKCNEDYAKFMRNPWIPVSPGPIDKKPKEDPVPPVITPKEDIAPAPIPRPLPFDEVVPVPIPTPQPEPIQPIEQIPVDPFVPVIEAKTFCFFGTEAKVRKPSKDFHLSSVNENSISDLWLTLSTDDYTNLLYDCLKIRSEHNLCDWAYLLMLKDMSESICGKETNESVLLMSYMFCQSGYKMRLGICKNTVFMLFASRHTIYDWNYYSVDGEKYYTFNNMTGNVRICNQKFPKEKSLSLLIDKEQIFSNNSTPQSSHQSKRNNDMLVTMSANQNMLDFYSSYPTSMIGDNLVSRWAMYANMPMPQYVRNQIYPQIRKSIAGVDQLTALNRILNWVQTGFVYEYDDKVWGDDRAFFPEESLYYPYCDCEDRSILLTRVVRDVLGLKCILIYYPGHLAAAVELTEGNPTGDYIEYRGHRFFITDGTITGYGAPVGQTMRGMDNKTAKVILLD